jgi:hypothetical protein
MSDFTSASGTITLGIDDQTMISAGHVLDATYTVGATTSANSVYITNNTAPYTTDISWQNLTSNTKFPTVFNGDVIFNDDVIIKGRSILETLKTIEDRLCIFRPNADLESRWEELRKLREQYINLEATLLEREQIYNTLKT